MAITSYKMSHWWICSPIQWVVFSSSNCLWYQTYLETFLFYKMFTPHAFISQAPGWGEGTYEEVSKMFLSFWWFWWAITEQDLEFLEGIFFYRKLQSSDNDWPYRVFDNFIFKFSAFVIFFPIQKLITKYYTFKSA